MSATGNFENQLQIGKTGEELVLAALMKRGNIMIDVRENSQYQQLDIDFRVIDRTGRETTLEIKNDKKSASTGNLFIEYANYNRPDQLGWLYRSKTEYFCFVEEEKRIAHIVSADELRQRAPQYQSRGAGYNKRYWGYCMPVVELNKLKSCQNISL